MITLPSTTNRARLTSFWFAFSSLSGLLVGVLAALLIGIWWLGVGVVLTLLLSVFGLFRIEGISKLYNLWNKVARSFGGWASIWLMSVSYYIVFFIVGRTGSSLRLARPSGSESMWAGRQTLPVTTYTSQYGSNSHGSYEKGWIANFLSWGTHSGNLWACCLLPFLILLKALEVEDRSSFPTRIYTLY